MCIRDRSKYDILREQLHDKFCQQQKQNLNNAYKVTEDGLLYNTEFEQPRVVITRALVTQVISQHHDTIFSGHQGIKKTIGIIKERYFWPTLVKDVTDYIGACVSCSQRKSGKRVRAPLTKFPAATEPFEFVSMDIVGPLPVSYTHLDVYKRQEEAMSTKIPAVRESIANIRQIY